MTQDITFRHNDAIMLDNEHMNQLNLIEMCARISYRSTSPLTAESANALVVDTLIQRQHLSVLAHGTLYVLANASLWFMFSELLGDRTKYIKHKKLTTPEDCIHAVYLYTINGRSLVEAIIEAYKRRDKTLLYSDTLYILKKMFMSMYNKIPVDKDIQVLMSSLYGEFDDHVQNKGRTSVGPYVQISPYHLRQMVGEYIDSKAYSDHVRVTCNLVMARGIGYEYVRHTTLIPTQESTRYVRYGSNKPMEFIIPYYDRCDTTELVTTHAPSKGGNFDKEAILEIKDSYCREYAKSCYCDAQLYVKQIQAGHPPQQARDNLPNALKTEMYMTGSLTEWKHLLHLRLAAGAHPGAQDVAEKILSLFVNKFPNYGFSKKELEVSPYYEIKPLSDNTIHWLLRHAAEPTPEPPPKITADIALSL